MILKYGNYQHDMAEAAIVIRREPVYNEGGQVYATRERWDISGFLQADTSEEITSAIDALIDAYAIPGQDAGLYLSDSSGNITSTSSHELISGDAMGGVRVVEGPSFPEGRGAEYATFRTYTIALEAMFPESGINLLAWDELVSAQGGGPKFIHLQTITGLPQKQYVAQSTPYQITQSGRAVGQFSYPLPAPPLWPASEMRERRQVSYKSPRRVGPPGDVKYTEWEVAWTYAFESNLPFSGGINPTFWS